MHRQTIEYIVAALIGVVVFIVVGFIAQGDGLSFSYWFHTPKPGPWALVGALVGLGVRFVRR